MGEWRRRGRPLKSHDINTEQWRAYRFNQFGSALFPHHIIRINTDGVDDLYFIKSFNLKSRDDA
jgi:hypothetical protein